MKPVTLLLLATLALVPALPAGVASHVECGGDNGACGSVTVTCGAATATGAAEAPVQWTLVVNSGYGASSDSHYGIAAQLAARTVCPIPGCTTGILYVNGRELTRDGLCQW